MAPNISDEILIQVASKKFPIIVLDRELKSQYIHNVLIDNVKGAYEAVEYLVKLGYKEIGYLSGSDDSYDNLKRFEGYRKTLESNKLNLMYLGVLMDILQKMADTKL